MKTSREARSMVAEHLEQRMAFNPFKGDVPAADSRREAVMEKDELVERALEEFKRLNAENKRYHIGYFAPKNDISMTARRLPVLAPWRIAALFEKAEGYCIEKEKKWIGYDSEFISELIMESWRGGHNDFVLRGSMPLLKLCCKLKGSYSNILRVGYAGSIGKEFASGSEWAEFDLRDFDRRESGSIEAVACRFNIEGDMKGHLYYSLHGNSYNISGDFLGVGNDNPAGFIFCCSFNVGGDIGQVKFGSLSGCAVRTPNEDVYRKLIDSSQAVERGEAVDDILDEVSIRGNKVQLVKDITQYFKGGEKYGS